jgi:hypothetical protein
MPSFTMLDDDLGSGNLGPYPDPWHRVVMAFEQLDVLGGHGGHIDPLWRPSGWM